MKKNSQLTWSILKPWEVKGNRIYKTQLRTSYIWEKVLILYTSDNSDNPSPMGNWLKTALTPWEIEL